MPSKDQFHTYFGWVLGKQKQQDNVHDNPAKGHQLLLAQFGGVEDQPENDPQDQRAPNHPKKTEGIGIISCANFKIL